MSCLPGLKGLSSFDCRNKNELARPAGFFLTTEDFVIDTIAHVGTKSYYVAGMIAGTVYHVPNIRNFEPKNVEAKYQDFDDGSRKQTMPSRRGGRAGFDLILDNHKIMSTYTNKLTRIIPYDVVGNMGMTSEDGLTNFKGLSLSLFEVENQPYATSDATALTYVEWQESEANEWNQQGYTIQPYKGTAATRWYPSSLSTVTEVIIAQVGTIAANTFVIDVNYKSLSDVDNDGAYVSIVGITGIPSNGANLEVKNGSGVIQALTSCTPGTGSQTNRYTVVVNGTFTAGTVKVKPTSTLLVNSDVLTLA